MMRIEFDTIEELDAFITLIKGIQNSGESKGYQKQSARSVAAYKEKAKLQKEYCILNFAKSGNIYYTDTLPEKSGVYFFFDVKGELVYIGSTKKLSQRIPQSFKARSADNNITDIAYKVTDTEEEARKIEETMIYTHKPKANVVRPPFCNGLGKELNPYELEMHSVLFWSDNAQNGEKEDWGDF